jgi:diguanylate cyclase (GGDEF)-like protein
MSKEGDCVKKAKKRLFGRDASAGGAGTNGTGADDDGRTRAAPEAPRGGSAKSVESMLQELSSGGSESLVGGGTKRASKWDPLWQLSMSDPHTGLANQLLLLDRLTQDLARRRRHGGEVVVCHVELDNLGEINMDLGYATGNEVLCEMSRRLTSVLRTEDTVGRVGGSELVVVMTVSDQQVVGPLMRRVQHTLDEPVMVGGRAIRLHASLGVAVAEDSESAEDVRVRADRSTRVGHR